MAPERGGTSDFLTETNIRSLVCPSDGDGYIDLRDRLYGDIYIYIFIQRIDMDLYSYIICIHSIIFHVPVQANINGICSWHMIFRFNNPNSD